MRALLLLALLAACTNAPWYKKSASGDASPAPDAPPPSPEGGSEPAPPAPPAPSPHYVPASDGPLPAAFGTLRDTPMDPRVCADAAGVADRLAAVAKDSGLSPAFQDACAGCHGYFGKGKPGFPALQPAAADAATFADVVRKGKGAMPAFPASVYPDDALAADRPALVALATRTTSEPDDLKDAQRPALAPLDSDAYAAALRAGLVAWRNPGGSGACVSCHGPDGMDLARAGYTTARILRRALGQGRTPAEAFAIAAMIDAQRRWLGGPFCSATLFRPFQPTGVVATDDAALVAALAGKGVPLATAKLEEHPDAAHAKALSDALVALDVTTVPLAIPLNSWSHDAVDGAKSTAEWIPELPMEPKDVAADEAWRALQNDYLAEPSEARFRALYDYTGKLGAGRLAPGEGVGERLSREKYRSVLITQHLLRGGALTMTHFPVWEVAQVASVMLKGCAETDGGGDGAPFPCWGYTPQFYAKMGDDRDALLADHRALVLPWLTAGFLLDPGLERTEGGDAQMLHWIEALSGASLALPAHVAYVGAVRVAKHAAGIGLSCWNAPRPALAQWAEQTLPALAKRGVLDAGGDALAMAENVNLMILLLARDALQAPKPACAALGAPKGELLAALKAVAAWGVAGSPALAAKQPVMAELEALLAN